MKVGVLTAAYPSPRAPARAVYIESLTRALVECSRGPGSPEPRVTALVVAPRVHADDPLEELREGVPVRRFGYPGGGRRLKELRRPGLLRLAAYALSAAWRALRVFSRARVDVIIAHWVVPAGPSAVLAAALLRRPLVLWAHGSDLLRYARGRGLYRRVARATLRRSARILVVSEELREAALGLLGDARVPVEVLPMGADDRWFGSAGVDDDRDSRRAARREELGVAPGARLLLYVGDLEPEKGVPELLEAADLLRARGLPLEVALAGEGPLARALPGGRAGLPAGANRFLGVRPQRELRAWHEAADLLVLPSRSEGSPVSVMEALASGLPVVASRVGGIPDLVEEGETGWLVSPGDARGLAGVLEGVLRDPALIARARLRLRQSPGAHLASTRARRLLAVLQELLQEPPGALPGRGADAGRTEEALRA